MNKEEFIKELNKLNITLNETQQNQLNKYYHLLVTENQKYNLTSIVNEKEVYLKHFYDSLTIAKIINLSNQTLCDIGSGAGFPGIVLKIAFPNLTVTLLDSTEKKCNFLNKVITTLKLKNINVLNQRAEIYSKTTREKYDIVTSRAVAPLPHLLEYSIPLLKVNGYCIAMKGNLEKEQINQKRYEQKLSIQEQAIITFQLPIENSTRTIIKYQKLKKTNLKYPRKYNEIKKKSL